ncbi:major facilitator superfamily domain-containing protein [Kalaharituber pfeilii]|nr:major facilitator superfamily domain-containing protein [Kalaharituber pfeilii]
MATNTVPYESSNEPLGSTGENGLTSWRARVGGGAHNGGGEELDLEDEESAIVETPTSSAHSKLGVGKDECRDDGGDETDELDSVFGDVADNEAAVPLKRMPRPGETDRKKKLKPGFREREDTKQPDSSTQGNDQDELVVRWSQDGGSPTSFRKLQEQHRAKQNHGLSNTARSKHKKKATKRIGKRRNGKARDDESGETDDITLFYSQEDERKVIRKMDKHLVGFLAGLYMLSFLDRSNIGNARIAGLEEDLELTGSQYEWLLTSFYITYIVFEWMTLLWRFIPAHKYIAWCVAGWGFIASIQALAWNWQIMMILRALLGVAEAAFGPGVPFYLSFFYRREELALRTGLFISAAPLATAYAGTLAYLITSIPSPLAPWRMLLIAEGFPSMIVAIIAWYWIPDGPEDQRWLGRREREIARRRVMVVRDIGEEDDWTDEGDEEQREKKGVRWGEVWVALGDMKNWITAMIFFSCNVAFSSLPVYLPTILNDMGYSALESQALSAPPYLLAFAAVIITTFLSDRHLSRSPYIIVHALLAASGYLFLAIFAPSASLWGYAAIYPIAIGVFSVVAVVIPWNLNNQDTPSKRGAGMVLLNVIGQMGPLMGTRVYPRDKAGEGNAFGMGVCGVAMLAVAVLAGGLRWLLRRENEGEQGRWRRGKGRGKGARMRYIL